VKWPNALGPQPPPALIAALALSVFAARQRVMPTASVIPILVICKISRL
jgi:hypothetical protein